MPPAPPKPTITTVQDLEAYGYQAHIHCVACNSDFVVRLSEVLGSLDPGRMALEGCERRIRCPSCGPARTPIKVLSWVAEEED